MSFPLVPFLTVCDFQGGTQPPKSTFINVEEDGYIRLLQIQDFKRSDKKVFIPIKKTLKTCQSHDILIARYGASLGKILTGLAGAYNVALTKTIPDLKVLDKKYLYYFLVSDTFQGFLKSVGSRAAQAGFNKDDFAELKIPLPPLETQKQIAAVLKKADQLRKDCQQMEKELNSLAQSVFIDMFGSQAESYSEWPTKRIEELAENKKGSMRTGPFGSDLKHSEFVDEGIAVIGIDNAVKNEFAWGERRFITTEKYEKLKRYRVYPKDLIITIMGTTGRIAVIPDDIPVSISTKHLAVITLDKEKVKPDFLAIAIKTHPDLLSQIKDSNKGAIMDGLNLSLIKALTFRLPPIDLQLDYLAALKVIQNRVDEVRLSHVQAVNLFNSLMQKAFSGELNLVNAKT